jgi:hypothetical protein
MSSFRALFLVAAVAIGTAQGAMVTMVNTFDPSQPPPAGGIGPSAPSGPMAFGNQVGAGVVIHALGVTFQFTDATLGNSAWYGDTIGTTANSLSPGFTDPVLSGMADGVLTLIFDSPSTFLSFNVLFVPVFSDSGGQVTIGGNSAAFTTIARGDGFSIGNFLWTPSSPFTQAVITFDGTAAGANFAMDSLQYDTNAPSFAPEPSSITLFGGGTLLLLGALVLRRPALNASNRH